MLSFVNFSFSDDLFPLLDSDLLSVLDSFNQALSLDGGLEVCKFNFVDLIQFTIGIVYCILRLYDLSEPVVPNYRDDD